MYHKRVQNFSIIIPSRNIANLTACVTAIRRAGETARIIWVDDTAPNYPFIPPSDFAPLEKVKGIQPFCFAHNINIGICAAGADDVILLNDDALLETQHGFSFMHQCLPRYLGNLDCGLLAASTNVASYPLQQQPHVVREVPFATFIAVLIPRRTIDLVDRKSVV